MYFSNSCKFSSMSRLRKWKASCSSTSQISLLIISGFIFFDLVALGQCFFASWAQWLSSPRSPTLSWSPSAILLAQLRRLTESAQPDTTDQSMLINGTDRATFSSEDQICVRLCLFTDSSRGNLEESFGHRADNKFARRFCAKLLA